MRMIWIARSISGVTPIAISSTVSSFGSLASWGR